MTYFAWWQSFRKQGVSGLISTTATHAHSFYYFSVCRWLVYHYSFTSSPSHGIHVDISIYTVYIYIHLYGAPFHIDSFQLFFSWSVFSGFVCSEIYIYIYIYTLNKKITYVYIYIYVYINMCMWIKTPLELMHLTGVESRKTTSFRGKVVGLRTRRAGVVPIRVVVAQVRAGWNIWWCWGVVKYDAQL